MRGNAPHTRNWWRSAGGAEAGEVSMAPQGLAVEDLRDTHSATASLDSALL